MNKHDLYPPVSEWPEEANWAANSGGWNWFFTEKPEGFYDEEVGMVRYSYGSGKSFSGFDASTKPIIHDLKDTIVSRAEHEAVKGERK